MRWEAVGEESREGEVEGVGDVRIRTAIIDGTVPDWHVGWDGRWSPEEYRMTGQRSHHPRTGLRVCYTRCLVPTAVLACAIAMRCPVLTAYAFRY